MPPPPGPAPAPACCFNLIVTLKKLCDLYVGITGENCGIDINECFLNTCLNGGFCYEPQLNMFACACARGFTGLLCETNVDECASNPCSEPYICVDGTNHYTYVHALLRLGTLVK